MLLVLLGAFPLINNWEPSDNNTLGHPANYITAAYETQSVRGAHGTQWRRGHKGLATTAAAHLSLPGPVGADRPTVPPAVDSGDLYPAEQGGSEWRRRREEPLDAEEKSWHNTFRLSQLFEGRSIANHYPIVVPHPTSTGEAGGGGWLNWMLKTQGFSKGRDLFNQSKSLRKKSTKYKHRNYTMRDKKVQREGLNREVSWDRHFLGAVEVYVIYIILWAFVFYQIILPYFHPICLQKKKSAQQLWFETNLLAIPTKWLSVANPKANHHIQLSKCYNN